MYTCILNQLDLRSSFSSFLLKHTLRESFNQAEQAVQFRCGHYSLLIKIQKGAKLAWLLLWTQEYKMCFYTTNICMPMPTN